MEYKIIFSDIDGTLLDKNRELSPLTVSIFRKLQKKIPVVLISSRMPQAMRHLQEKLEISHQPLICYNGALVILNHEVRVSIEIPFAVLEALLEFNSKLKCHISIFNNEDWYVPEMDFWAKREENTTKVTPQVLKPEKILSRWKKDKKGAHKIMCMGKEEIIDEIYKFLNSEYGEYLHLYRSKPTYLEIASKEVSKLTAINMLLQEHFRFQLKEAVAFGDNYNDFEMLKAVGMGIAVGNAKPEILAVAKEITHHGREDGVAKSLQKLFKLS